MRAMRIHGYGDTSVIRDDDIPRPTPGPGEVLIKVAATSFNPSEIGLRRGLLHSLHPLDLPYTLGGDVAGTVVETGDRVIGRLDGGAAAEYVVAPVATLVPAPTSVPLEHAAAIPIAGVTAWQAVFEHAKLAPGQRVLINGAGGAVGGFAVQLAKHAGARVIATAAPRSTDAVRRQGADQIIDYTATPVTEALDEPLDAVLNLAVIPARKVVDLVSLLRPGGVLVSATVPVRLPADSPVTATHFVVRNDIDDLRALVGLVDAGTVRLDVTAVHPFTDLAAVHQAAEAGRTRGKVILTP
jgi:NADPH:quinone reductase-like Zn-dependent oxidoreductase